MLLLTDDGWQHTLDPQWRETATLLARRTIETIPVGDTSVYEVVWGYALETIPYVMHILSVCMLVAGV